jgi:hypothetical protein
MRRNQAPAVAGTRRSRDPRPAERRPSRCPAAIRALERELRHPLSTSVRATGAGLLLATGAIHLSLYVDGYRGIPVVGPLFLADVVLAVAAAVVLGVVPVRRLPWVSLAAGLFVAATLGALVQSLTVGVFGFTESVRAPLVIPALVVEGAGALVLLGYAAWSLARRGRSSGDEPEGEPGWPG